MFWIFFALILVITNVVSIYYAIKFARIIFIVEDDLSEAIETFNDCIKTFDKILQLKLFFDSPEVRPILMEALENIRASKLATQAIAQKFVERSKQKYIQYVRTTEQDDEENI